DDTKIGTARRADVRRDDRLHHAPRRGDAVGLDPLAGRPLGGEATGRRAEQADLRLDDEWQPPQLCL
ncbi:MAG: hypothetical protein AVDCRST_MAG18-4675, partial [uncultured Thermomicrobiales bacterium]